MIIIQHLVYFKISFIKIKTMIKCIKVFRGEVHDLPIIIVLERHWDIIPKQVLLSSLPQLKAKGYNTFCFEDPRDVSNHIARVEGTIQFIERELEETKPFLEQRGIDASNLCSMDYEQLCHLLQMYVSSKHFSEMALWFRELPGHKEKLKLLKACLNQEIELRGVDINQSDYKQLHSKEAKMNLDYKVQKILEMDDARVESFRQDIISLQNQNKGVIFLVGQFHFEKLLSVFAQECYQKEILFIQPHAPSYLAASHNDVELTDNVQNFTLLTASITENTEMTEFGNRLNAQLDEMIAAFYTSSEVQEHAVLLEANGHPGFTSYRRGSFFVDCITSCDSDAQAEERVAELKKSNISSFRMFHEGKPAVCIPAVNDNGKFTLKNE